MSEADHESPPWARSALVLRGRSLIATVAIILTLLPFGTEPLSGRQTEATIDAAGSVVEYDGFLPSGAATISPMLRLNWPNASLGLQGSWVIFESSNQIVQATAAGAWLTPGRGPLRAEFSGSTGVSQYADQAALGHLTGRTRIHFYGERSGGWLSLASGWTFEAQADNHLEVGIGGWSLSGPVAFGGNLIATWVAGDSYVDLAGSARWTQGRVQIDGELGIRPWVNAGNAVGDPREGAFAEVAATVSLADRVALMFAAGSYPSEPARSTLAAKYLNLGFRVYLSRPAPPAVPTISRAVARAAEALAESDFASRARLELDETDNGHLLRILVGRARSVELMGDFTDWQPVPLYLVDNGIWQITLQIPSGVHRLNVRVDGGQWLVPLGTRLAETDFGDAVGIIVIP